MQYIIDVRTQEEYDAAHIPGAILHDIVDMMDGIYPDLPKDVKIMLYCQSGNRAEMAKGMMESQGFMYVTNGGGMDDMM